MIASGDKEFQFEGSNHDHILTVLDYKFNGGEVRAIPPTSKDVGSLAPRSWLSDRKAFNRKAIPAHNPCFFRPFIYSNTETN